MLILKPHSIAWSVAGAKRNIPAVTFIAQTGLNTRELAHMLDSLVRVSRRAEWNHLVSGPSRRQVQLGTFAFPQASLHVPSVLPAPASCCWHTRQETPHNRRSRTSAALALPTDALHPSVRQSRQDALVPFASLSAISGTFNSLFKVLFIFPSWYLFSIGLELIFSFRWNLPPTLHSTPKECDSRKVHRAQGPTDDKRDSHPQRRSFPRGLHLCHCW